MGKKTQEPRTKGNVKPSKSENAANYLATKKLDNIQGFAGLAGGLGFMRSDNVDSDVDADIRQIFRRLDKKDTLTKQKALQELLSLTETKGDEALIGAFPYWPRLYSRLSMDDDNKVRAISHKVMSSLAARCGRNMAPHLKSILPVWILGRGDDYDPAATAATHAFETTFPAPKRADALRHAWSEVFDLVEETLFLRPPIAGASADAEMAFASLARHLRNVGIALRAITLLYPLVKEKGEAAARLLQLLRDKRFWSHYSISSASPADTCGGGVAANDIVRIAYFDLVTCLCQESEDFVRQPACAAAICEVVLRDIGVNTPLVAGRLWEAILVVMKVIGDQVWRHVSFKKSFYPSLCQLLTSGGHGCARKIYPCLLPLFSQLCLGESTESRQRGCTLLEKVWEGLHQPRVIVTRTEASAIAKAYMECCRFLIAECLRSKSDSGNLDEEIKKIIDDFANRAEFECLSDDRTFQACGLVMAEQYVLLLGFLYKRSANETEGGIFGFAVRKLMTFVADDCALSKMDVSSVISYLTLLDSLAQSNELASKKSRERNVSFKVSESKKSAVVKMIADWAPSVIGEIATILLRQSYDANYASTWLPILSAFPEIRYLTEWFELSDPLKTMMNGMEKILSYFEEHRSRLMLGSGAKSSIFDRTVAGYCTLLNAFTLPDEAGNLVCHQFDCMENTTNRLTFLSLVLTLMLENLSPSHAACIHKGLEPKISEWSRTLIAAVLIRLDSGAEASFRGVLDMLLHYLPSSMISLWAFRSELLSHVARCVAGLDPEVGYVRSKCRRLVSMLSHLLEKCGNEVVDNDERIEALEEVIMQLNSYLLCLLKFETKTTLAINVEEQDQGTELDEREDSEAFIRRMGRKMIISIVKRRLESDLPSSDCVRRKQFIPSLVNSIIDSIVDASTDSSAYIIGEEFGVELLNQIILTEQEMNQSEEHHLLSYILKQLTSKCISSFRALDNSVFKNHLFQMIITTRDHRHHKHLSRALYLMSSIASVSAPILKELMNQQSKEGLLSSLLYSNIFISSRLSNLGIENTSDCLSKKLNNFEEKHREVLLSTEVLSKLTNDLFRDSSLWQQVIGDLICRQSDSTGIQTLINADHVNLRWLDDEELERVLSMFLLKDLPFLLQKNSETLEIILTCIESRLKDCDKSDQMNSCIMRILASCAYQNSDACIRCFSIFQCIHDLHEEDIFSGEEDAEDIPVAWRLETVLAAMRLMQLTVRHHPAELEEPQWDLILCSSVSWLSLLSEAKDSQKLCIEGQRFTHHLLMLLAALGATVSDNENLPSRIHEEWNNFYVGHLYDAVLNQFSHLLQSGGTDVRSDPQTIVLCDAVARTPAEHLLVWKLSPKLRIDESSHVKDQPVLTIVNTLSPLLYSDSTQASFCIQVAACSMLHTLARSGKLSMTDEDQEESETFRPPESLVDVLRSSGKICRYLKDSADFGGGAVGIDRLLEASADEECEGNDGEMAFELKEHVSITLHYLAGYLMTWRVLLASFTASLPMVKARFATWMAETGFFDQLQQVLFRIVPLNPIIQLHGQLHRHISGSNTQKLSSNISLFDREVSMMLDPAVPFMRRSWLLHLAASVYMQVLRSAPALMRQWWLGLSKKESGIVERYTERQISPILVTSETDHVNARASEVFPDKEVMQVKGKSSIREIHAIYRVTDEHRTELLITLPTNYPLGPITVQTFKKIGISAQQWRSLQLQMTTFLQNQNGTVLEGLSLWKRNIDTKMEGVEDCMICFSILHGSNYQLPRMSCQTCKKKFHSACLYKWFQTSQNHTCPLCRNMFEMSNARH